MCLHQETEQYDKFYEEGYLVEYAVKCVNCGKHLDRWAYGSWMGEEE